ncbi:MAG TPA: hypothetical protein VFL10_02995 [Ornithinibacter sp.]|nr:hypothetical protein [Ornithinibacter sp.]
MLGRRSARALAPLVALLASAAVVLGAAPSGATAPAGATSDAGRSASSVSAAPDVAGAMHVLPARRVLDTRSGLGAAKGPRASGSTTSVTVLGVGGVPASGVGAVAVHVTVTGATGSGFVTAYPGGTAVPPASTVNVVAGQNITNLTVVAVGADSAISLRFTGTGTVQLLADVAGWTTAGTPTEPGTTVTSSPARLMDTRTGLGGRTGALPSGGLAHLQVTGKAGVPATIGSVTLNVTVVTPTAAGWLAVTPTDPGAGKAKTSSLNFTAGRTIANAVTTSLSPTGTVDLRLSVGSTAHVVVDVLAWTVAGTPTVTGSLAPREPVRLLDTRTGNWAPPVEPGGVRSLWAGGGATVLNITAVGAQRSGFVTVSAEGAGTPNIAQLTVPVSVARAALVVVPAGLNGNVRVTVSSTSSMHLVVDQVATIVQPTTADAGPAAPTTVVGAAQGSGVRVSWPAVTGAAGYVVTRLAGHSPASPFQGHQVWNGTATTLAFTDATAAPGVDYTYAAYTKDAGGNLSEPALTTAGATPLTWTAGARVSPFAGGPVDVSCPTTTWCLAVGQFGESWIWSGGAWATSGSLPPDPLNPYSYDFVAVSCPSTTFCLAVVNGRGLATWRAGSWTLKATAHSYEDVSCWSTTGCGLVVGDAGTTTGPEFERWTSGSIGGSVSISGRSGARALSCPTSTCSFLTHKSGSAYVHRVSGTTATTKFLGYGYQGELSCVTSTWCLAVVDGRYRTGYGTTWSAPKPAAGPDNGTFFVTMDLSCPTTTSCTLVGILGSGPAEAGAKRWNGSSWTERGLGAALNTERAVDCASASQCLVVDERGRFNRWTGSAWTARSTFANTRGGFTSLDCTSATSCLATDDFGNVLQWAGGTSWPRTTVSEGRSFADCAGSTCMAVDLGEWTWRVRKSGTWGPTQKGTYTPSTPPLCATSTRCFSLSGGNYLQWNGTSWSDYRALPVDLGNSAAGDCPTTTFCLAVAPGGRAVQWNGTRWVSRGRAPLPENIGVTVDCVSPGFCMAMADGASAVLTSAGWRSIPRSTYAINGLACRTATLCLSHSYGSLVAWDGVEWAPTSMQVGDPASSGMLSCVGTARCVVAAGEKVWWTS